MSTVGADARTWLSADVPTDVAERFSARAREQHRSARAQIRVLVEEFALNEQSPGGHPGSDEISGGGAAGNATG